MEGALSNSSLLVALAIKHLLSSNEIISGWDSQKVPRPVAQTLAS